MPLVADLCKALNVIPSRWLIALPLPAWQRLAPGVAGWPTKAIKALKALIVFSSPDLIPFTTVYCKSGTLNPHLTLAAIPGALMAIRLGDPLPDFPFQKPDGTACHLSDFRRGALLLVFLRHLA